MVSTEYSYFLIVSCFMFLVAMASLYFAYRFVTGKEKYKIKNNRVIKVINLLCSCLFIIIFFFTMKNCISDMINYQPKQYTGTVVETHSRPISSFIYEDILMDDKNQYTIFFNKFVLEEGKTYTITYLPNTGLIVDAYEKK